MYRIYFNSFYELKSSQTIFPILHEYCDETSLCAEGSKTLNWFDIKIVHIFSQLTMATVVL